MNLVRVAWDRALSPVMVTGEGWRCGYAFIVVGAAFSVPCVKRPDLLPGLSLCTEPSGGDFMAANHAEEVEGVVRRGVTFSMVG